MTLIEYILSFKNILTEQGDLSHKNRYQIYHAINEQCYNQKLLETVVIQSSLVGIDEWLVSLKKISELAEPIYNFLTQENELKTADEITSWVNQLLQDIGNHMLSDEVDFRKVAFLSALKSALGVKIYGFDYTLLLQSEVELDPDDWESAYFTSIGFAGFAIWEDKNTPRNDELRKQFWIEYLDKIIEILKNFKQDRVNHDQLHFPIP